jgi:phosphoketolase
VLRRPDGSTAAERFFGKKHEDLFAHLVEVMAEPARPRQRKKKERKPLLPLA